MVRYPPPPGARRKFSIAAVEGRTPSGPLGPFVAPGSYQIRLTVDGVVSERDLEVRMDPRVAASEEDIRLQSEGSMACYRGYLRAQTLRDRLDEALAVSTDAARRQALRALRGVGLPEEPDTLYSSIREAPDGEETVVGLQEKFLYLMALLQEADARPTTQARHALEKMNSLLAAIEKRWAILRP